MDELLAVVREMDAYAGAAGEEDARGDMPFACPRRYFVRLRKALGALQAYNEDGVYECMGCREIIGSPGSWCGRCKRIRAPQADKDPWKVQA